MRIVVITHLTLDGVMQAPGRPDDDTRGGFSHGGWAIPGSDQVMRQALAERMGKPDGGLLLGRRSYNEMLTYWNAQGGPYKDALNTAPKVRRLDELSDRTRLAQLDPPPRRHPRRCGRAQAELNWCLVIMGSGQLIRSLLPHRLIDECLLMI